MKKHKLIKNNDKPDMVVLIILDGWGVYQDYSDNAITQANTPVFDKLISDYPVFVLQATGNEIGLEEGELPNCRIGHLCLGTGREIKDRSQVYHDSLSNVLQTAGIKQLSIADSEKIGHLLGSFNGNNTNLNGDHIIIPTSLSHDYEKNPQHILPELTESIISNINSKKYQFIIVNIANAYLTNITGNFASTVKSVQAIDSALEKITKSVIDANGVALITADHGQVEFCKNVSLDKINKKPTENNVPLIFVGQQYMGLDLSGQQSIGGDISAIRSQGSIRDIAPTILEIFNLAKPETMTGKSLI